MHGLLEFHRMAAARGDGLRPELLALLQARTVRAASDSNVADIGDARNNGDVQAGPNPIGTLEHAGGANVVPFPSPKRREREIAQAGSR